MRQECLKNFFFGAYKAGNPENVTKLAKIKTTGLYRFGREVCRFDTLLFLTEASVPELKLRY